jgi:hypothetical protein
MLPEPDPKNLHSPRTHRNPAKIPPDIRPDLRAACKGEKPWPVTISGPSGTGKTCAGLVVADFTTSSKWFTWDQFVRDCRDATMEKLRIPYGTEERKVDWKFFWGWLDRSQLLVLDDVGCRGKVSDEVYEVMKTLLDRREGRGLILTTNVDVDKFDEVFDARILDRLLAGTVIYTTGDSLR